MKNIVCFGEILWDNFPAGPMPGGAPMNVSYHLQKLGIQANLISRIGFDDKGKSLMDFMKGKNLTLSFVQTDTSYSTGQVEVALSDAHEATYTIVQPVAWDFIEVNKQNTAVVQSSDAIVYGSLSARSPVSRDTLFHLLEKASFRVMDVNLRPPHFDQQQTLELIARADVLKVNQEELSVINSWLGIAKSDETRMAEALLLRFGIAELIVTKGSAGAALYRLGTCLNVMPPRIKVVDTVGSGDAFLAGFLVSKLNYKSDEESMKFAAALAGIVAASSGACPDYLVNEIKTDY